MTVPNVITIMRLMLVPVVVWALLADEVELAFVAFITAGISDGIDGYIARRFSQHSELGAYLDPIADKALLVATFIMLGWLEALPLWLVTMVIARDAIILAAVLLASLLGHPIAVRPLLISKANTAVQIGLALLTLGQLAWFGSLPAIHAILIGTTAGLTLGSGLAYCIAWLKHMSGAGLTAPEHRPPDDEMDVREVGQALRRKLSRDASGETRGRDVTG